VRICLLTDADVFAGTERHMLTLACGLRAIGVEAHLAAPSPSVLEEQAQSVSIPFLAIAKHGLIDKKAIGILRSKLQDGTFDIVHAHNGRTALQAAIAVRLAGRGHCITTQHFLEPNHATQQGVKGTISHLAHRWVSRHTLHVIAISRAVRQAMLARREVPDTKITVVWNGIDPPDTKVLIPKAQVREALGIPAEAPLIVCAARLEKEKDVGTLIAAMERVTARLPEARCVVAGTGKLDAELSNQICKLGLENSVMLLGFRSDVLSLIQAGDLFVLPSPAEAFGLAVIEAMALSKSVIATRAGGPLEIVAEGETGLLVPPSQSEALSEAILSLLLNTKLRERMGEAGKQRFCTHFHSEQMTQATLAVYLSTLV